MNRIAFLGPEGTYSEAAAQALRPSPNWRLQPMSSFEALFELLDQRTITAAVVPLSNSIAGVVDPVLSRLIVSARWPPVTAEHRLVIRHHLLAAPGTQRQDVTVIYTHPQPQAQCTRFFKEHPSIRVIEALSTVDAVLSALAHPGSTAAIASDTAAAIYAAAILQANIQDRSENVTRFLRVGGPASQPEIVDTVALAIPSMTGSMAEAATRVLGTAGTVHEVLTAPSTSGASTILNSWLVEFVGSTEGAVSRVVDELLLIQPAARVVGTYVRRPLETGVF